MAISVPSSPKSIQASRTTRLNNSSQRRKDGAVSPNPRLKPRDIEPSKRCSRKSTKFKSTVLSSLKLERIRGPPRLIENVTTTLSMVGSQRVLIPLSVPLSSHAIAMLVCIYLSKTDFCTKLTWNERSEREWKESRIMQWCRNAASSQIWIQAEETLSVAITLVEWSIKISSILSRQSMKE